MNVAVESRHLVVNALTVDVEDYFQVWALSPYIPRSQWDDTPCRVERNVELILQLLADGLSNGDVAERLFISQETVKSHVRHILTKLEADTRTQAVAIALREAMIDQPPVENNDALERLIEAEQDERRRLALFLHDGPVQQLSGIALAVGDSEACYVPVGHRDGDTKGGSDLFAPEAQLRPDQIPEKDVLGALRGALEDPSVLKIGQDLKYHWLMFARRGIEIQ